MNPTPGDRDPANDPGRAERIASLERRAVEARISLLEVTRVPHALGCFQIRITAARRQGLLLGWAPQVFWSEESAWAWLAARSGPLVTAAVRDCEGAEDDLTYPVALDQDGRELLVGEAQPRVASASAAAYFASVLRTYQDRRPGN